MGDIFFFYEEYYSFKLLANRTERYLFYSIHAANFKVTQLYLKRWNFEQDENGEVYRSKFLDKLTDQLFERYCVWKIQRMLCLESRTVNEINLLLGAKLSC